MLKKFAPSVLLILLGVFAGPTLGQKPPKGDTPATSALADELDGSLTRVGNDGLGSYFNGTDDVSSIVQGIGNWVLDTKSSNLRRARIDLGDPVPGTNPNPPFPASYVPVRFISKCTTSIFTLAEAQSILCPLAISLDYDGTTYALRSESTNYPGTEPVRWTCLARNSTKCVSWQMLPSTVQADGQRKIVMQLLKPATSRRSSDQLLGRFYVSFDLSLTTP